MNSHRTFLPLLRFAVNSMPSALWAFPAISIALVITLTQINGERSGFEGDVFSVNIVSIPIIIGLMFFNEIRPGTATWAGYTPVSYGEFLFARPILRTQAYRARILVYFILVLAAPLVGLGLASRQPEMTFSLFKTASQSAEAALNLSRYQAAFPNNRIIHKENNPEKLVIPQAHAFVAGWELFITTLVALAIQIIPLLNLPKKFMPVIPFVLIFAFGLVPLWDKAHMVEYVFLFFAGHWGLISVLTVALTAVVQWFAARRVREMEVI